MGLDGVEQGKASPKAGWRRDGEGMAKGRRQVRSETFHVD